MSNEFRKAFTGFGCELLDRIREAENEKLSDAAFEERTLGIQNATSAMIEAGVDEETIIRMLQKYWDLRLSDATDFVENSKSIK
ncbi:MAG: hypothetical protein E7292_05235 [Lachnospiraceae bacterium]|nr:hypothetical protein [Lachnospiraceae bacterium]